MRNQTVRTQFNKQDDKFANWAITRNREYMQAYFDFCQLKPFERILDVACGPGEFTRFLAERIQFAYGVDISETAIELANRSKTELQLSNIQFDCSDVEHLPYPDNSFTTVLCKSAFHHFIDPLVVFEEMFRCCEPGGQISIQDLLEYDSEYVNRYFEEFDRLVDVSHQSTLSEMEFRALYDQFKISITSTFNITVDLHVGEYLEHAHQEPEILEQIQKHLQEGEADDKLEGYLFRKDGELYFKRPIFIIIGNKQGV